MIADNELTARNFVVYAAKHYDNPSCLDDIEFLDDLKRFKYLKRLLNKYVEGGELNERLILNHILIIYNLFGRVAATKMLFLKLRGLEKQLKTFLLFLSLLPKTVDINQREIIVTDGIPIDDFIMSKLQELG